MLRRVFSVWDGDAQFATLNGKHTCYLPRKLTKSDSGLNMRLKIMGEPVYRKIFVEITHRSSPDSKPCIAHIQLDSQRHVSSYHVIDKVFRKGQQGKTPNQEDSGTKQKSFWVPNIEVTGVTAIGLDAEQNGFDIDTRNLFSFLQHVARTASADETCPLTICVNAHYRIDGDDQKKSAQWMHFKAAKMSYMASKNLPALLGMPTVR